MPEEIVGHRTQRDVLSRLFHQGKLPSTILLAGPGGIGKSLAAKELARSLVCEHSGSQSQSGSRSEYGGCTTSATCHGCRVFDASNHPDVHWVSVADKELASVESCRELLFSLHLAPLSAKVRVVVFDQAERLTLAVANTLLKILEEPPANTYFILVASNASRLPPTLLSRCQIWFFDVLTVAQIKEILSRQDTLSSEEINALALIADGALEDLDQIRAHIGEWQRLCSAIDEIIGGSRAQAALLASELSKSKDSLPTALKLIRIHARQRLLQYAHEGASRREVSSRLSVFVTNLMSAEYFLFERNLAPVSVLSVIFDALAGQSYAAFTSVTNSATVLSRIAAS